MHRPWFILCALVLATAARWSAASETVIGLLLPTGQEEAASLRAGADLAIEQWNATNAIKARLLVRGRESQWGTEGQQAAEMVLDANVRGIIAPRDGAASHLALQIAGRTATPVVSLCPDSSVIGAGIPWLLQIVPGTRDEALALFTNNPARHRWIAFTPDGRPGREVQNDLRAAAAIARCDLAVVETAQPLRDQSPIAARVLAMKPDGILVWLDDTAAAGELTAALRAAGFGGVLAAPSAIDSIRFSSAAGDAANGVQFAQRLRDTAAFRRFAGQFRDRFLSEAVPTAAWAFDATALLLEVLQSAGERPARAMFPLSNEKAGATGLLKFDRSGHRAFAFAPREEHVRFMPESK